MKDFPEFMKNKSNQDISAVRSKILKILIAIFSKVRTAFRWRSGPVILTGFLIYLDWVLDLVCMAVL